jgi:hypothetical protein
MNEEEPALLPKRRNSVEFLEGEMMLYYSRELTSIREFVSKTTP